MSELVVYTGTIERTWTSVSKTGVHIHNVILRQSDSKLLLFTSYDVLKEKPKRSVNLKRLYDQAISSI